MAILERMSKEAVLLNPGQHLYRPFLLNPKLFALKPGVYRVDATWSGWGKEKYTGAQRSELGRMRHPFMTGVPADSTRITLTPSAQ